MFVDILEFLLVLIAKSSQKENDIIMKFAHMEENNELHKDLCRAQKYRNKS